KYGVVTANLALLRRAFAKKCPKIVTTWIAQQNRAVHYYRDNPDAAAKSVATEIGIKPDVAAKMMSQSIWLDARQQMNPKWMGSPGKPGKLVDALVATAKFLEGQQLVTKAASPSKFENAVVSKFIKNVAK